MRGKLIVVEGIDGAGGETQTKLLMRFLRQQEKDPLFVSYPDYTGAIGRVIHGFLHQEFDFPPDVQFALYATDMVKDRSKIMKALKNGRFVVANRYVTTTLVYQSVTGFPLEKGLKFVKLFELPEPDLVIYLNVSVETSMERKMGEKQNLDKYESDKAFLEKVRKRYLGLARKKIFGQGWKVIDGEKTIEEVAAEIQRIVSEKMLG